MKKARMNISHSRFILFKLKIFGEIVTTYLFCFYSYAANTKPETSAFFKYKILTKNTCLVPQ